MNLYEFLGDKDIALPMTWDSHDDFEEFLNERLNKYLCLVDDLCSIYRRVLPKDNRVAEQVKARRVSIGKCVDSIKIAIHHASNGKGHHGIDYKIRV